MDLPDNVCEPCQYRHVRTIARIHCNTCQESYCKPCADVHGASKIGRLHLLIDIQDETIKKTTLGKELENSRLCKIHCHKSIEFYCSDHDDFLCSMCLLTTLKHKHCTHIFEISSAGKALIENKFASKIDQNLRELVDQAKSRDETAKKAMTKSKEEIDSLNSQLDNFVEKLDTLVISLKQQAIDIKHETADEMDKQQIEFERSKRDIRTLVTSIDSCQRLFHTLLKQGSPADVFRCAVSMVGQYNEFKAEATQMKTVVKVVADTDEIFHEVENVAPTLSFKLDIINEATTGFSFTTDLNSEFQRGLSSCVLKNRNPSVDIQQICTEMENVDGKISDEPDADTQEKDDKGSDECVKNETTCVASNTNMMQPLSKANRKIRKRSKSSHKCKNDDDKYKIKIQFETLINFETSNSRFGGIVGLPDGKIVLSDFKRSMLLILNSNGELLDEIPLSYVPANMTTLDNKYLLVCVMKIKLMLVLEIGTLRVKTSLKTKYHPRCLQAIDSTRMLVSMKDSQGYWYLDVMTIDGTVTRRIELDRFYDGNRVAIQHLSKRNHIINCCECSNTIRRFESTGKLQHTETIADVSSVVTDQLGFIYVIKKNGNIVVYSPNFENSENFTSQFRNVNCATFNASFDKLYMTVHTSNKIMVMNVSRTKLSRYIL